MPYDKTLIEACCSSIFRDARKATVIFIWCCIFRDNDVVKLSSVVMETAQLLRTFTKNDFFISQTKEQIQKSV